MPAGWLGLVRYSVDGEVWGALHGSVLERVVGIAERLGCVRAPVLGQPSVVVRDRELRGLVLDLEQVVAFADAARATGWALGRLAAAPWNEAVAVLDDTRGRIWVHPARGFELHHAGGVRRITELPGVASGPARRVPLVELIGPLVEAASRAMVLELFPVPDATG
ncbi:hypothetical protein LUW76_33765 [Actinomadura madurae]|uniref:hypothetical protein n=1 Tax=Actinomadura madurae TaxID=1993 RepID=UPI0020260419|nr:hypothetical protein [Actinomadura madurae]URM98902.1 hypothetical protein LUW76_33765 [Actinomadura madurae]URN09596.1 hypothetical protein LUW74_43780 [Actinomadura madurae]